MTVIGITGVSGSLGKQLVTQLDIDDEVERIVGIDIVEPPAGLSAKLTFVQRSVTESFADVFAEHGVNVGVHLAALIHRDRARERAVNIDGTREFLAACSASSASTVCVVTSALAYGAREDASLVLYEGAPLQADPAFGYAHDQAQLEELCYDYVKDHPDVCLQIVRPCPIVGPNTDNQVTRMLERSVLFVPWQRQHPPIQLLHEDDATRALHRLIKLEKVGVFNLAPDGALSLPQMARIAEIKVLALPFVILQVLVWLGWKLGWSELPPAALEHLRHTCFVAGVKLKSEAMFMFRYDTPQAFLDFLEARTGGAVQTGGYDLFDELEELDDDDFEDDLEEAEEADPEDPFLTDFGAAPEPAAEAGEDDPEAATESEALPDAAAPAAEVTPEPEVAPEAEVEPEPKSTDSQRAASS